MASKTANQSRADITRNTNLYGIRNKKNVRFVCRIMINMNDSCFFLIFFISFLQSQMQIVYLPSHLHAKYQGGIQSIDTILTGTKKLSLFPWNINNNCLVYVSSTKITIFSDDISTIEHWTR